MEMGKRQLALDNVMLVIGEHRGGNWVRPGRIQKVGQGGNQAMGELSSQVGMQDGEARHCWGAQDHKTLQSIFPEHLMLDWGSHKASPGLQGPALPCLTFLLCAFSCWDAHPNVSMPRELCVSAVLCVTAQVGAGSGEMPCPCGAGTVSLSLSTGPDRELLRN